MEKLRFGEAEAETDDAFNNRELAATKGSKAIGTTTGKRRETVLKTKSPQGETRSVVRTAKSNSSPARSKAVARGSPTT
jgi:hypothetical protein